MTPLKCDCGFETLMCDHLYEKLVMERDAALARVAELEDGAAWVREKIEGLRNAARRADSDGILPEFRLKYRHTADVLDHLIAQTADCGAALAKVPT